MSVPSLQRFRCCGKCGCTKPLTSRFWLRDRKASQGFRYPCKVCSNKRTVERHAENPEIRHAALKRWEAKNKEYKKRYMQENADLYRHASQKHAEANREKRRESSRKWRERNPHRWIQDVAKRRARKLAAEHVPYTAHDINEMWHAQSGCCYYCDIPVFGTYHIDHRQPLSRGGADRLENLCVACPRCNLRKHDKTEQEFAEYRATRTVYRKEHAHGEEEEDW